MIIIQRIISFLIAILVLDRDKCLTTNAIALSEQGQAMAAFDYGTAAELFAARSQKTRRQSFGYRRFARAADAIRFAIEEIPPALLLGTYLEVDEERFASDGIRRLYESADYPLTRRKATG